MAQFQISIYRPIIDYIYFLEIHDIMHYKVFLDTNIYDAANYSFRNDLFMQMRNYAESGMLEMQICSVVKNEVCRHIKNKIKGTVKNLNQILSSRDLQLFRTLPEYKDKMETSSPSEWVEQAFSEFDCFLKDCKTEEITSNGIDVEGVLDDYFEMRYPFETAKKEEFPDAIIIRAVEQEIRRLSKDNILVEHKTSDGLVDDMLYCIVSDDNGFMTAMKQTVGERPSEDVKYFSSLNELINFFAVQDKQAAELQEKLNNGYARELIETTIEEGVSSAALTVDEPDGYVEDTSNMGTGDYLYDAFVISLQEMEDGSKFARIYLDVNFVIMLDYEYLNAMESYWDREDNAFLWTVMTEKVARFKANTVIGFTIIIDKDGNPEFNDYVEMPSDIEIDYKDLIEVISCENRNSY